MEIKADQSRSEPLQLPGSTSAGRVICGTDLAECVSVPGDFLWPQVAFPPGFYLLRQGWVNRPVPEAPLIFEPLEVSKKLVLCCLGRIKKKWEEMMAGYEPCF